MRTLPFVTAAVALPGALAVVIASAGCRRETPQSRVSNAEPATLSSAAMPDVATLKAQMRDHAAHAAAMRDAVTRADLDAAKREARTLAELHVEGGAEPAWRERLDAMNAAASRVAAAKDLAETCRELAGVARTCGDCHATLGGPGHVHVVDEPPDDAPGVVPRMKRHEWGAARLWDGLIAPSNHTWKQGARVLMDAPLEPEALTPGKSPVPAIGTLATSVHDLGRKARVVEAPADRAAIFAELMTTCSACHQRLGGGPPARRTREEP
jgi:mono/diheme cytochrome c family protein